MAPGIWQVLISILLVGVLYVFPLWKIARKAGYAGSLSLLMLVPVLNIALLWLFALADWPLQKRRDRPAL